MRTVKLTKESTKDILENLLKRSPNNYGKFEASVQEILNAVKENGDKAVFEYTEKFDGVRLNAEHLLVTEEEIAEERRKSDEFVNQPCYDADGVPILPGETVYSIHSGMPHKIIYTHCGIFCFENPMDHYDPRFPEHSKFPIVAARMTHRKPDDCEERA